MEKLKLVLADEKYKAEYIDFVKECNEDIKMSGFDCCIPISTLDTVNYDIYSLKNRHEGINLPKGWVKESILWMIDEFNNNIIIGCISIRHSLNENLKFRGGHIAYYIRMSKRNRGYGSKMLCLGLKYAKEELNMDKVLITCSMDNIYSVKTIMNNSGVLHSEDVQGNEKFRRYYIYLVKSS